MKNNLLKRLAQKAKDRMLGKEISNFDKGICIKVINGRDDDFYLKAREVFAKSESDKSFNPIKMLMDENVLIKLDARGREKYLLDTIDKYIKAKNEFMHKSQFC